MPFPQFPCQDTVRKGREQEQAAVCTGLGTSGLEYTTQTQDVTSELLQRSGYWGRGALLTAWASDRARSGARK